MHSSWRKGREGLPSELHHRPLYFLQHWKSANGKSADISASLVSRKTCGLFKVLSPSGTNVYYTVDIGDVSRMPSCDCMDFARLQLPCKHFMAVFRHFDDVSWKSLPAVYRDHPLFVVDPDCLTPPAALDANSMLPIGDPSILINRQEMVKEDAPVPPKAEGAPDTEKREILDLAVRCRDLLSKISKLTYHVRSGKVLKEAADLLSKVHKRLAEASPSSSCVLYCVRRLVKRRRYCTKPRKLSFGYLALCELIHDENSQLFLQSFWLLFVILTLSLVLVSLLP
jgi:hypothetical protein